MTTKDKVMVLARDFIQERGVNGFSFADIANSLEIKRASIHYYFPSKTDLIEAVLDQYTIDFFEALEMDPVSNLEDKLKHFVDLYEQNLIEHKICLCSAIASEGMHVTAVVNEKVDTFFEQNRKWLQTQMADLENARDKAEDFFACIQGAQLIARHQDDIGYFQRVMTRQISELVS